MSWIPPLQLETFIVNIFSGNIDIFTALAFLVISGLAGFFRMGMLTLFLMIGLFFMMFKGYVNFEIYFIIISIGGLLVGYWISKIVKYINNRHL